MIEHLTSRSRLRVFIITSVLALLALVLLRLFAVPAVAELERPGFADWLCQLLDELIPSLLGTLLVVAFVFLLWPPSPRNQAVVVSASEIRSVLMTAVQAATGSYWFRGRTASFVTATVLPRLLATSKTTRKTIEVHLQLLDPDAQSACEAYASYRNRIKRGNPSCRDIQIKLAAHITAIYRMRAQGLLSIKVTLLPFFSLCRFDANDSFVVLTREDPSDPALKADQGPIYDMFLEDLRSSAQQGRLLPDKDISQLSIRDALKTLGVNLQFTEQELDEIQNQSMVPEDPYAR